MIKSDEMILYLSTGFHSDNHNPSNEINFLLIFLHRKLWKSCFWYNHQESNTWDPSHFVAIKKKEHYRSKSKEIKKKYRCESQWFTKTTDHGTLRTAFQTLQLISDNEQKDDGNIREKFMMREDREIIEQ